MINNLKFRIWDGQNFLYSYAEKGESFKYGDKYVGVDWFIQCQRLESPTRFWIQQFIGLTDRRGREIYDGDIISFQVYEPHDQGIDTITNAEVFWDEEYLAWNFGRFENKSYSPPYKYSYDMSSGIVKGSFEITGNIFENK